jgi:hypothetical protein
MNGTDAMLITNKLEDPNTGQDREQSSTKSRKSGRLGLHGSSAFFI